MFIEGSKRASQGQALGLLIRKSYIHTHTQNCYFSALSSLFAVYFPVWYGK